MRKIQIGIVGYGNIGRGAVNVLASSTDMELKAVFTRREKDSISVGDKSGISFLPISSAEQMTGEIDVMLLCGGSAADLPEQGPYFASMFNTVDSYDTHAKIPEYMASIDAVAKNTTSIISAGWDPGPFSMMRSLFRSILPNGKTYTFWGKGVSQGHSNAIRRIKGVTNAIQYTIPIDSAVEAVRNGDMPDLTPGQSMVRECFVVAEPGADKAEIEASIKTMPHYFAGYDTTVNFISDDDFTANHLKMLHGGMVIHTGTTGGNACGNNGEGMNYCTCGSPDNEKHGNNHVMEFSLKLDSNPEFTASIMISYARAAYRLSREGSFGAKTVFDVPVSYLSEKNRLDIIKELL